MLAKYSVAGLIVSLACHQSIASDLTQGDAQRHYLTLYQQRSALVESQFAALPTLTEPVLISGLPAQLQHSSLQLQEISAALSQWHQAEDPFSEALQQQIGQQIQIQQLSSGKTRNVRLLAIQPGMLLIEDQQLLERIPLNGDWQPRLPLSEAIDTPHLRLYGLTTADPARAWSLSYLTTGIGWQPEYSIELNADQKIRLSSKAHIENATGVNYPNASIALLGGSPKMPLQPVEMAPRALALSAATDNAAQPEALQGYYLYRLPKPVDLPAQSDQRVDFLPTLTLDADIRYRYREPIHTGLRTTTEIAHAGQWLSFKLPDQADSLPLPAGAVQLYLRSDEGQLRFIGSDWLTTRSPGDQVDLNFGESFDLKLKKRQTAFRRIGKTSEQSYEVTLSNGSQAAKSLEYSVQFTQPWSLIDATHLSTADGMEARWLLEIPARSEIVLGYTVKLN